MSREQSVKTMNQEPSSPKRKSRLQDVVLNLFRGPRQAVDALELDQGPDFAEDLVSSGCDQPAAGHSDVPQIPGRTLTRTASYTFKRAFFRAYIDKHVQDPSHLGTIIEGSCPFVQDLRSLHNGRHVPNLGLEKMSA
jgi:hypothetical protein